MAGGMCGGGGSVRGVVCMAGGQRPVQTCLLEDIWLLVTEECMVDEREVRILLECFLVHCSLTMILGSGLHSDPFSIYYK